jgi:hypothetical protein
MGECLRRLDPGSHGDKYPVELIIPNGRIIKIKMESRCDV